jgi:putative transposase
MSILTYKLLHHKNFSTELQQAVKVAKYALKHKKCRTTKDVKHIGMKACIANQILKKYGGNKKLKNIRSVKLTINGYFIGVNKETKEINIPSLKLKLNYEFPNNFIKVNQVELDHKFIYVAVEIQDKPEIRAENYLGVDRNTTGHCAVVAIPHTGKVFKLGKQAFHIHRKYKKIRSLLQKANAKRMLKVIGKREKNIIKDINHKISKKIVELAIDNKCGIKLENLKGIRKQGKKKTKKGKSGESFKSSINTWEFYQLGSMIEYKSKICGIPVVYIDPRYTSQKCSRCGLIGNRNGKSFSCLNKECGHVDHADSNAAFNIAAFELLNNTEGNDQSILDRDNIEGSTDTPQLETQLCESKVA